MNAAFAEVLAAGFDGKKPDMEKRIVWIAAPDLAAVYAALDGMPYKLVREVTAADVGGLAAIDYFLPDQSEALRAALVEFSQTADEVKS